MALGARTLCAGFLVVGLGCGGDSAPPAQGGSGDAAARDAGADAGAHDAAPEGGSLDAGKGDAGGWSSECSGDILSFEAAQAPGRPFSAAIEGNQVKLLYVTPSCGGTLSNNQNQGLTQVSFDTKGEPAEPQGVVNAGVTSCSKTRDPALVMGSGTHQLFYVSNATGTGYELSFKNLDPSASAEPLDSAEGNEFGPAATWFAGSALVVYPRDTSSAAAPVAGPILLSRPTGAASELVGADAGHRAIQLTVAELGRASGDPVGVAAFRSDLADAAGIYLQVFGEDLAAKGTLRLLTDKVGAASNVAAAGHDEGGAVAYTESLDGVVHQLRFRHLGEGGDLGDQVELTTASQNVRDVALTRYASGYLLVYRRLGGAGGGGPSLRMMAIDDVGNLAGTRYIAEATSAEGTQVLVAADGRIIVIWADAEAAGGGGLHIRAARLTCL